MKKTICAIAIGIAALFFSAVTSMAQSTPPTLVQQLTSYLAFQIAERDAECPSGGCYHFYAAQRLTKQLAAAVAAQNAGTPLPPILQENGQVAPVYVGTATGGATGSSGSGSSAGAVGALGHNSR